MTFEELESEALKLPIKGRAELAHRLLHSLHEEEEEEVGDPDIQQAWVEEAERRHQEFLEGKAESIPGEQAIEEVRAALRHR